MTDYHVCNANMTQPPSFWHRLVHLVRHQPVMLVSYAWDEQDERYGLLCIDCGAIEPYAVPRVAPRRRLQHYNPGSASQPTETRRHEGNHSAT